MPASDTDARANESSSICAAIGMSAEMSASPTPFPPGILTDKVDAPMETGTALIPFPRSAAASATCASESAGKPAVRLLEALAGPRRSAVESGTGAPRTPLDPFAAMAPPVAGITAPAAIHVRSTSSSVAFKRSPFGGMASSSSAGKRHRSIIRLCAGSPACTIQIPSESRETSDDRTSIERPPLCLPLPWHS